MSSQINWRNVDNRDAKVAQQNIEQEIKNTRNELEVLDKTLQQTSYAFYKELCKEVDKSTDNEDHYKNIYVDILNQWTHDIHDIEVNIVQFNQWLQNEKQQGLKAKLVRRDEHQVCKPIKRLQSGRNRSAKSIVTVDGRRSPWSHRSANSFDALTHVKTNRTLQLRKANTERKKKEKYKDPYYIPPQKRKYKKLENYTKEDVYNRLTETTTIAYDQRQKLKPVIKLKPANPSLMTLWSKTGSMTSSRRVTFSAKHHDRPDASQYGKKPDTPQDPHSAHYNKVTRQAPSTQQYNTARQSSKITGHKVSKIPRPVSTIHHRPRELTNNNWTEKQNRLNNSDKRQSTDDKRTRQSTNENTVDKRTRQSTNENTKNRTFKKTKTKPTNIPLNINGSESGKASSASTKQLETWQDLSNMFPPKSDDFSDIKSSYGGAQKIYGIPKKKGTFTSFLKRNSANIKKNIKTKKEDQKITKKCENVKAKHQIEKEAKVTSENRSPDKGMIVSKDTVNPQAEDVNRSPDKGTIDDKDTVIIQDNDVNTETNNKQTKTKPKDNTEPVKESKTHKHPRYRLATSLFSKGKSHTKPDNGVKQEETTDCIKNMSSKYTVLPSISNKKDDTEASQSNTIQSNTNSLKGTNSENSEVTVSADQTQSSEQSSDEQDDTFTNKKDTQLTVIKRLLMQKPKSAHLTIKDKTKIPAKSSKEDVKEEVIDENKSLKEDVVKVRKSKSDHSHILNCDSQTSQKSTALKLLQRKLHFNYRKKTKDGKTTSEKSSDKKKSSQRNNTNTSRSERKKQKQMKILGGVSKSTGTSSLPIATDHVGLVNSDSAATKRLHETPIQGNTFEELDLKPTEQHVFTKFSDDLTEKAKLAKLDERFLEKKARVERSVKKNHIEVLSDDDVQYEDDDDLQYSDDDGSDEEKSIALKQQTLLLKKRIDQRKKAIMCKSQQNWPYCNIPGFVDTVITTEEP